MDEEELREAQRLADEQETAAMEAAREVRAMLLPIALRSAVETAEATISAGLSLAHRDEDVETADGTVWALHTRYQAEGEIVRIAGHPRRGSFVVGGLEQLARAMGAQAGAFDFTLPLTYAKAAAGGLDVASVASLAPDPDLAERLHEAWMTLVEGAPATREQLDTIREAGARMRGEQR